MNFKKLLPLAVLLLFAVSCNKSDSLTDNNLVAESTEVQQGTNMPNDGQVTSRGNLASYSQNPSIEPLRIMFGKHEKYHATVEPWGHLPESVRGVFKAKFEEEQALMKSMGHDAYLDQKAANGTISNAFGVSMKNLRNTITGITSTNVGTLVQTLEGQRNALSLAVPKEQSAAQLVYDILFTVINDLYPEGDLEFRGDHCKLKDWIEDIMQGAEIGAIAGEIVSTIFANDNNPNTPTNIIVKGISISLTLVGAIIGGIVGGIVGLFNGNDCDCGRPDGISIVTPNGASCTSSYQLYAWGAGGDAEFFDWTVAEGNSTAFFPGQPALLGPPVTQASPSVPLFVSVLALCAEAMGDPIAMAQNTLPATAINLYSMPATQVGDILVVSNYNLPSGINVQVGNSTGFGVSSTAGMWNNTYSVSIFPPYLGTVTQNNPGSFTINWTNTGSCTITFTGTNTCSGLQSSTSAVATVSL